MLFAQSSPTLCDPVDDSLRGSSVRGIFQARILEWVAMPSRGSSGPRNGTQVSNCRQILYHLSHISSIGNPELLVPLYD